MVDVESDPDWLVLSGPPKPGWSLGSRTAVHLEGEGWDNLDFLVDQKARLRQLMVKTPLRDFSGVNELEALERLILFPYGAEIGLLDLSQLPSLSRLSVIGSVPIAIPPSHPLRWLQVERIRSDLADSLRRLSRLEVLRLTEPIRVPGDYPESLIELDINSVRHWDRDVATLRGISELRELYLSDVRGMRNLQSFSEASRLDRIYAEDCDELVSLEGISLTPSTQYLFVGRTPLRRAMPARWEVPE